MFIETIASWVALLVLALPTLTTANPVLNNAHLTVPPSSISPTSTSSLLGAATPTCFANSATLHLPINTTNPNQTLTSFPSDCIAAMKSFLNQPPSSLTPYRWKRIPKWSTPAPGEARLPFIIGEGSCVLELDVLEDSRAEDQFALYGLKDDLLRLFRKCVRGEGRSGFVAVGPRKVVGLVMKWRGEGEGSSMGSVDVE